MKTKLLKLSCFALLFFTFLGCCDDLKTERDKLKKDLNKTQDSLQLAKKDQARYHKLIFMDRQLFPFPENGSISQNSRTPTNTNRQKGKYEAFGYFDVSKNILDVNIPVTDNTLYIKHYTDISSKDTNALLIVLNAKGNSRGRETPLNPIKKIISKQFDIDSLGLDKKELKKDGKIKIIVLHEDSYNNLFADGYRKCIKNTSRYNKSDCLISTWWLDKLRPEEDGGDIIIGG